MFNGQIEGSLDGALALRFAMATEYPALLEC